VLLVFAIVIVQVGRSFRKDFHHVVQNLVLEHRIVAGAVAAVAQLVQNMLAVLAVVAQLERSRLAGQAVGVEVVELVQSRLVVGGLEQAGRTVGLVEHIVVVELEQSIVVAEAVLVELEQSIVGVEAAAVPVVVGAQLELETRTVLRILKLVGPSLV